MRITFRIHAIQRLFQRAINVADVRLVIENGEIIENYPDDTPYPSRLLLGWCGDRPVHVVAADNQAEGEIIIITVYEPDPQLWEADFRSRRKP
jgi:hypothetical protein